MTWVHVVVSKIFHSDIWLQRTSPATHQCPDKFAYNKRLNQLVGCWKTFQHPNTHTSREEVLHWQTTCLNFAGRSFTWRLADKERHRCTELFISFSSAGSSHAITKHHRTPLNYYNFQSQILWLLNLKCRVKRASCLSSCVFLFSLGAVRTSPVEAHFSQVQKAKSNSLKATSGGSSRPQSQ